MLRRLFLVFILISTFAVAGCKISGTITTDDGVGVEGITVVLKGEGKDGDALMSATAETDADGNYVFVGLYHGTVTITPESEEYTFDPLSIEVTVDFFENLVEADFVAATSIPPSPPPSQPPPPWSAYQGNPAHTGYVPVWLNPDNFSEASWSPVLIESVPLNPVATGDGKVFVTTVGDIFNDVSPNLAVGLDSATGAELWRYNFDEFDSLEPIDYINPPAYATGFVYVQSGRVDGSFLVVLNAQPADESGEVLDDIPYDNQSFRYYAPTIYDGDVYVGGGQTGGVYAYGFDGFFLEELWFEQELSQSDQWTPAVDEDRVITYTGLFGISAGDFFDAELTVFNRSDSGVALSIPDENFKPDLTLENHLNLAPILGSQNNVIAIQGGRLINFDLTDEDGDGNGSIGWEKEGGFSGQPSLAQGIIFAIYEGGLHALNESDGSFLEEKEWQPWQPPGDDESINAPMIVTDNLIFVSTDSATYAVDLVDQNEREIYSSGGHLAISEEGLLFIATNDGRLIAINLFNN